MTPRFCRYQLRTTDVDDARRFYAAVLGREELEIALMPERARAAGAPAHWLGTLGVDDVAGVTAALVARGGEVRGPALRAPEGAMIAVGPPAPADPGVAWHELHAVDEEKAWQTYAALFGWRETGRLEVGGGPYRTFTWAAEAVGGFFGFGAAPGRHAHWLFYFAVPDLDAAIAAARASGARAVLGPHVLPDGKRLAQLDDAQGAAFGLVQG